MTPSDQTENVLDHAFAALQEALISLEQAVEEQAERIQAQTQPPASDEIAGSANADGSMSAGEKQAVQHELSRLKATIAEATSLVLNAQKNKGTG